MFSILVLSLVIPSVVAVNTCAIEMCTASSGNIKVALYDTAGSNNCHGWAQNVLVEDCGVDFQETKCIVDCSGIYSWHGAYWKAMGCDGLGWPCGFAPLCPPSVKDVCQRAAPSVAPPAATGANPGLPPSPSNAGNSPAAPGQSSFPDTPSSQSSTPDGTSSPISNLDNLSVLSTCQPCGASQCDFTSDSSLTTLTYGLTIGSPVSNCQNGTNSTVTSTVGGSILIGDSWSAGVSVGIAVGPLNLRAGGNWSQSHSISWSQSVSIQIQPGQKGVLVATVEYKRSSGSMKIAGKDTSSPLQFPVISNQPVSVLSVGPEIVPCASEFSANSSSNPQCASAGVRWGTDALPTPFVATLVVLISLLMRLL